MLTDANHVLANPIIFHPLALVARYVSIELLGSHLLS